ncbi:uncharacterized protein PITG_08218 [Phytophthora infestans T30-4]|uniref:Uncharacterized protein n=1 Tax=Phytophthora infestans (strain T30-4) TaxID=403677 RepID=D0N9R6_PHYIT|nr:uncharacterized protein PITG_08218 [Phytophthora infestans T30-4]EEY54554.1 conserved hypothetical protein [Phytophthora infestans T30-4]|eukprot:XP_002904376.1 conserved hypothetical protein [Phytophthora infestans T30-4]
MAGLRRQKCGGNLLHFRISLKLSKPTRKGVFLFSRLTHTATTEDKMQMKVAMDKQTSRRVVKVTNYALVQVLKATVARLRKIEMELGDLELALEDEQEEVESYSDDIDDCHDRIEDIDEFVRELEAGNVHTVSDVTAALAEMTEERQEEHKLLKVLGDARASHEQQFEQLQSQSAALKAERLLLTKTRFDICCLFRRNGVFDLVRRRLAVFNPKLI